MGKKIFLTLNFISSLLWAVTLVTFAIFQTGCNDSGKNKDNVENASLNKPDSGASNDWITIDIKFKANTDGEMRDMTIRAIEKLLVDSLKVLRSGRYPNYSPSIKIAKSPFNDTLDYLLSVGNISPLLPPARPIPSTSTRRTLEAKDTISNPTCRCVDNCGICETLMNSTGDTTPINPYRNISTISFPGQSIKF